jgi:prophage regulatory protein
VDYNTPQSPRLIRLPVVEARTGYKKSKIYKAIAAGAFPPGVRDGRSTFWVEEEVNNWIRAVIAKARRAGVEPPQLKLRKHRKNPAPKVPA